MLLLREVWRPLTEPARRRGIGRRGSPQSDDVENLMMLIMRFALAVGCQMRRRSPQENPLAVAAVRGDLPVDLLLLRLARGTSCKSHLSGRVATRQRWEAARVLPKDLQARRKEEVAPVMGLRVCSCCPLSRGGMLRFRCRIQMCCCRSYCLKRFVVATQIPLFQPSIQQGYEPNSDGLSGAWA